MDSPAEPECSYYNSYDSLYWFYFDEDPDPFLRDSNPLWWKKPGSGDGRRRKGKKLGSTVAAGAALSSIMKTVVDPNNTVGKRRKQRLLTKCADTFAPGVMYSMEKRKRWAEANPASLLDGVQCDEVSAQVVEWKAPLPANYWRYRKVVAVHELDENGVVVSKVAGGRGTSLSCLTTNPREKDRRSRHSKYGPVKEEDENGDVKEVVPRNAQIRYEIMHEKPLYFGRHTTGKADFKDPEWPLRGRPGPDCSIESDFYDVEQQVYAGDDAHEPRREQRFNLGDFIAQEKKERSRRARSSKLSASWELIDLPQPDRVKPFDLVNIASVPKGTFEFINVDTAHWTNFNFIQQVEALSRKGYEVRWLDRNSQRVLVDATNVADKSMNYEGEPTVVIVFERISGKNNLRLRVHLNTTIPADKDFDWKVFRKHLTKCKVLSIEDLLWSILQLVQRWKSRTGKRLERQQELQQPAHWSEHHVKHNVREFMCSTIRITHKHMASILRETENLDKNRAESEGDNNSGHSLLYDLPLIPLEAKCSSCGRGSINRLYEMDDGWMCRQCVAQWAIRQIRVDCVPIHIPFVIPPDITTYDVLPSILPLPLFNFYTKYTAVKRLQQVFGHMDLHQCPGCKQTVELRKPNEYNCALCLCGTAWCTVCKKEPHWPMTCEMAAEWRRRWTHRKRDGDRRPQWRRQVTCCCLGPPIVFDDFEQYAECENCKIAFDPQTMLLVPFRGRPCRRIRKFHAADDTILPYVYIPRIKKKIVEICEKARASRLANAYDFDKACRKLKDSDPDMVSYRKIVLMVLYIIEYGTAWVHMQKSLVDYVELNRNLTKLVRLHEEFVRAIECQRPDSVEILQSLEVSVRKTIDLIKENL